MDKFSPYYMHRRDILSTGDKLILKYSDSEIYDSNMRSDKMIHEIQASKYRVSHIEVFLLK